MTACVFLLWLNETRLSLPHFSITVRSYERREAEVVLWSWISVEASAKERMPEDVMESRSFMERMESKREMTKPWGTPALIDCRLERKQSTLTAIDLSRRNYQSI